MLLSVIRIYSVFFLEINATNCLAYLLAEVHYELYKMNVRKIFIQEIGTLRKAANSAYLLLT